MLLPMLLRTLMSGPGSQGETTRKELSRVAVGIPSDINDVLGIKPATTGADGRVLSPQNSQQSLPTLRTVAGQAQAQAPPPAPAPIQVDEGIADADEVLGGEEDDEFDEDALSAKQKEALKSEKAAEDNGKGGVKIGFFLHTPFPSSEIYRILPVRREILLGVLQCDLIG